VQNLRRKVHIYIKIDAGYHRTGLAIENKNEIENILHEISKSENLQFSGFLAHFGNTYNANNKEEIKKIYKDSTKLLLNLKQRYQSQYPDLILSIGDTPSCSIVENFEGMDEIRPGNFIFYDLMQYQLGACELNDIALVLACPVVALHPDRNEVVFYGGGVHLSKEFLLEKNGAKSFGKVVELNENGWGKPLPGTFVSALSQEHGTLKTTPNFFKKFRIGDVIGILPIHSCMTANLANSYLSLNKRVLKKMRS
jgi:D-serine deaminase-like pyridoxal phosphate-dependent protein